MDQGYSKQQNTGIPSIPNIPNLYSLSRGLTSACQPGILEILGPPLPRMCNATGDTRQLNPFSVLCLGNLGSSALHAHTLLGDFPCIAVFTICRAHCSFFRHVLCARMDVRFQPRSGTGKIAPKFKFGAFEFLGFRLGTPLE